MKYVVYRRVYRKGRHHGRSKPVGYTSRLRLALAVAAERNATRREGEWYGVSTSEGLPIYRPAVVDASAFSDRSFDAAEADPADGVDLRNEEV